MSKPKISKAGLLEAIQNVLNQYDLSEAIELREGKNDKVFAYGFAVAPKASLCFDGEELASRQVQVAITFQDVKTSEFVTRKPQETAGVAKAATLSLADLRQKLSAAR